MTQGIDFQESHREVASESTDVLQDAPNRLNTEQKLGDGISFAFIDDGAFGYVWKMTVFRKQTYTMGCQGYAEWS
jgi:hypothetical protein